MKVQSKQVATLLLWALLTVACGSSAGTPDMSMSDGSAGKECPTSCPTDQVCSDGTCQSVPAKCPCPKETYCDLASNSCKRGCSDDTNCSAGKYCDPAARTCIVGCKLDPSCGAGMICQAMQCVAGCRTDAGCGEVGKICDSATLTCHAGCRTTAGCQGATQVCDTGTNKCVPKCVKSSDCAAGKACDLAFQLCVPKCGATDNSSCADNQACVAQPDGTYGCSTHCRSTLCKGAKYDCTGSFERVDQELCRVHCRNDDDCAADEACTYFQSYSSLCAKKCSVAGCDRAVSMMHGMCTCSMTYGVCVEPGGGDVFCAQPDLSYGL